ncbi:MAG: RidA family protein [Candidatus Tectomicrobia bacterium]|nr:RidA family protein [Candidatus Tectomicrobia bacterium]
MPKTIIRTDRAAAPVKNAYSQATSSGPFIFTAGQVALDPQGQLVGKGDITRQTEQVLENIKAILAAAGASMEDVLKTTVFIARVEDYPAMNEVYFRYFPNPASRPARSTLVAQMVLPDLLVEIEAVAARGE